MLQGGHLLLKGKGPAASTKGCAGTDLLLFAQRGEPRMWPGPDDWRDKLPPRAPLQQGFNTSIPRRPLAELEEHLARIISSLGPGYYRYAVYHFLIMACYEFGFPEKAGAYGKERNDSAGSFIHDPDFDPMGR